MTALIWNILKNSADKYKDHIAIEYGDQKISYDELYQRAIQLSEELKQLGMKKGDNVLLAMDNCIEFAQAFFAINLAGGTIIPVYMNIGENKLINIINFYEIKFILTIKKYQKILGKVVQNEINSLSHILYITNLKESLDKEIQLTSEKLLTTSSPYENSEVPAIILFSSGTTSMPKGIMLSDNNIQTNVEAISDYLHLKDEDKILLIKNINHASSITGELLVSINNGSTLFMVTGILTASHIMETIEKNKITVLFGVPTILSAMMTHSDFDQYDLTSLKIINFYGASMASSKIKELATKFPKANIIYSYGLTEAAPRVTYIMRDALLKKEGSSGIPIKDVEVRIVLEDKEVTPYTVGEICVKGPNVMVGYYKNSQMTKDKLRDNWLHTGDLGYKDEDGYLYVTGRKDNLIIKTGKNIYPEEIEAVIMGVKGVKEVLVRGEEDDLLGEDIVAYIVMANDTTVKLLDILKHCQNELEDYKIPGKVYKVDSLEKTISGKIIRKQVINNKS